MDLVLNVADHYVLTPYVYPLSWPEDTALRQIISLLVVTNLGIAVLYLGLGWLSYQFIFDHNRMKHPQFLKNQVWLEIRHAMTSLPIISIPTVVLFFIEVKGYSKLYDNVEESPMDWPFVLFSIIFFVLFTDGCIYWIHRFLHHRCIYKHFHKKHHVLKIPTPFASHAFHPLDGFLSSLPYHVYPFLFPLHKVLYLALYIFVNIWTVSIHDGAYRMPGPLQEVVNGAAHHTDHHLCFNVNYGQYFTLWDRIGGSYKKPSVLEGKVSLDCISRLTAEGKISSNGANANGHTNGHDNGSGTKSKEE
ncbi:lathosterol oxidase-like [Oncorhynchus nerka]|uniref:lathosterol oxidase-like n=1 Tax=Oncorhynchus nerka TaxID=8023 RepID=UPI001130F46B|nr:lathosterol oxidase-like [Oncorhynchus nerka]